MVCRELGEYRGKCGVLELNTMETIRVAISKNICLRCRQIESGLITMLLYVSFQKPQHADDSELKDNIIYHYRGKDLVGITVVGAKEYGKSSNFSSL